MFALYIFLCIFVLNNKQIYTMKAIDLQKRMNMYLVKRNYRLAYKSFLKMTELREVEGLPVLTMPNLQARFE